MRTLIAVMLAVLAMPRAACADAAQPDLRAMRAHVAGPRSQVMVLGTAHLRQLQPGLEPALFDPLLERLAKYAPTIIATEVLSGEACQVAAIYKVAYEGVAETYCQHQNEVSALAAQSTGLDVATATLEARTLLAAWPKAPAPAARRHLAAVFAAAGDHGSALVQWTRLPESERLPQDGLGPELVKVLESLRMEQSEVSQIAVRLAVRLGIERLHPSDDHTADSIQNFAAEGFGPAIQELWKRPDPHSTAYRERVAHLGSSQAVLDLYRFLNSAVSQQGVLDGEWKSALSDATPERYGRQYVAWWETRNLRMAANIRADFGNLPGARVLMIVGASHKPYLDAYLGLMHEVQIQDVAELLH